MVQEFYLCILENDNKREYIRFDVKDYEENTLNKEFIYNNYLTLFVNNGYNVLEIKKKTVTHKKKPNGTYEDKASRQVEKRYFLVHLKKNLEFSFIRFYREDYSKNDERLTIPIVRKLLKNTICKEYEIMEIEGLITTREDTRTK